MLRVVAYDIASPKRLRKVALACLDFGIRIEKSVFECDLADDEFEELWKQLCAIAEEEVDALVCYPICAACEQRISTFGPARHLEPCECRVL